MNDHDIDELMRREADRAPLGDGSDLLRGRARLRRRRLLTGGSAVASVALAVTLVGGYLPASGPEHDSAPVSKPDSSIHSMRDVLQILNRTGGTIFRVLHDHTRLEDFAPDADRAAHGFGRGEGPEDIEVDWATRWHEAGGVGLLQVIIERDHSPSGSWGQSCTDLDTDRIGASWPDHYDLCEPRAVDDQAVLYGVERRDDRLWMVMKHVTPDDTLVVMYFNSPAPESGAAPVLDPSLSFEEMVDAVTDPRMRVQDEHSSAG